MKKKLRLRQWVKDTLTFIVLFVLFALAVGVMFMVDARFKQLCENGYARYCPVER